MQEVKTVIRDWHNEIIKYTEMMCEFHKQDDIIEILQTCSALSSRVTLMRIQLSKSSANEATRFRIDEIDPFLLEVDRQFKTYSRIAAIKESEWGNTK